MQPSKLLFETRFRAFDVLKFLTLKGNKMYKLYYMTGACSLATQIILCEINADFELVNKDSVDDFKKLNPVGTVPVLTEGNEIYTEGAAIILHLLEKHDNNLLPASGPERKVAIENLLFANATMQLAYSKLFFIAQAMTDSDAKLAAFESAQVINNLWSVVEQKLGNNTFLGGDQYLLQIFCCRFITHGANTSRWTLLQDQKPRSLLTRLVI